MQHLPKTKSFQAPHTMQNLDIVSYKDQIHLFVLSREKEREMAHLNEKKNDQSLEITWKTSQKNNQQKSIRYSLNLLPSVQSTLQYGPHSRIGILHSIKSIQENQNRIEL